MKTCDICGYQLTLVSAVPPWDVWHCKREKQHPSVVSDDSWDEVTVELDLIDDACPKCGSTKTGPFMGKSHCWDCGTVFTP